MSKSTITISILATLALTGCSLFTSSQTMEDTFAQFLAHRSQITSHQIDIKVEDRPDTITYQRDQDGDIKTIYQSQPSAQENIYIHDDIYYFEPDSGQWYQLTLGKIDLAKDLGRWDVLSWQEDQLKQAESSFVSQQPCGDSLCETYQISRDNLVVDLTLDRDSFLPVTAELTHDHTPVTFTYSYPHLDFNPPENAQVLEFPQEPSELNTDLLQTIYGEPTNRPTEAP